MTAVMLLLSACSMQSEDEIQQRIDSAVLEKEIREEVDLEKKEFLFKSNLMCQDMVNELKETLKNRNELSIRQKINFEYIFYSPKTNSCLYIDKITFTDSLNGGYRLWETNNNTKRPLEVCLVIETSNNCTEFDKKIEEYYKAF